MSTSSFGVNRSKSSTERGAVRFLRLNRLQGAQIDASSAVDDLDLSVLAERLRVDLQRMVPQLGNLRVLTAKIVNEWQGDANRCVIDFLFSSSAEVSGAPAFAHDAFQPLHLLDASRDNDTQANRQDFYLALSLDKVNVNVASSYLRIIAERQVSEGTAILNILEACLSDNVEVLM
jgi:hypothetical protein